MLTPLLVIFLEGKFTKERNDNRLINTTSESVSSRMICCLHLHTCCPLRTFSDLHYLITSDFEIVFSVVLRERMYVISLRRDSYIFL